jgi:microcystin-dependent protein
MKSILAVLFALCLASLPAWAVNDVPGVINYQGRLLNSAGANVADGTYGIAFRLYGNASGPTALWGSSYSVVIAGGSFNTVLGEGGSALAGVQGTNLLSALQATATPYLGITVLTDSTGANVNNAQEIVPRMRLLSSPYALVTAAAQVADTAAYATNAGTLGGLLASQFLQPASTAGTTLSGGLTVPSLTVSGTATLNGNSAVNGNLNVTGTLAAGSTTNGGFVPVGGIIMWSGNPTTLPAGWQLCDGSRTPSGTATPDLRDRFIVGAGGTLSVGTTGGRSSVTLAAANLPAHTHNYKDTIFAESNVPASPLSPDGLDTGSDANNSYRGSSHGYDSDNGLTWVRRRSDSAFGNASGGVDAFDIRPPFYALAFIIRVR